MIMMHAIIIIIIIIIIIRIIIIIILLLHTCIYLLSALSRSFLVFHRASVVEATSYLHEAATTKGGGARSRTTADAA